MSALRQKKLKIDEQVFLKVKFKKRYVVYQLWCFILSYTSTYNQSIIGFKDSNMYFGIPNFRKSKLL